MNDWESDSRLYADVLDGSYYRRREREARKQEIDEQLAEIRQQIINIKLSQSSYQQVVRLERDIYEIKMMLKELVEACKL